MMVVSNFKFNRSNKKLSRIIFYAEKRRRRYLVICLDYLDFYLLGLVAQSASFVGASWVSNPNN